MPKPTAPRKLPTVPEDASPETSDADPPSPPEPDYRHSALFAAGWLLRWIPDFLLQGLCGLAGNAIYAFLPKRRRILLSNLHHAYPELGRRELKALGWQSARRVAEMGLWLLISPHYSTAALNRRIAVAPGALEQLQANESEGRASVLAIPHTCLMEMLTSVPTLPLGDRLPPCGVIYRSLNQVWLDNWVRRVRERHGFKLLSRRGGFTEAVRGLKEGGMTAILFDQHAGSGGWLTVSLGRPVSASPATGRLCRRYGARLFTAIIERDTFLRGWLRVHELPQPDSVSGGIVAVERWLERWLQDNPDQRPDWLWMHNRWKAGLDRRRPFCLVDEEGSLAETCAQRGWEHLPRNNRCWVLLPHNAEEVAAAAPFLLRLRESRPDCALTIVVDAGLRQAAERELEAEDWRDFPHRATLRTFRQWAWEFPDIVINLASERRAARGALVLRAPLSLGPPAPEGSLDMRLAAFFRDHGLPEVPNSSGSPGEPRI